MSLPTHVPVHHPSSTALLGSSISPLVPQRELWRNWTLVCCKELRNRKQGQEKEFKNSVLSRMLPAVSITSGPVSRGQIVSSRSIWYPTPMAHA